MSAMLADIPIDMIDIGDRLRAINEDHVAALAASITEVGLLNPITVFRKQIIRANIFVEGYGLIAGAHRFEAVKRVGQQEIASQIMELSDLQRQLAECDENLCSTRLTPAERALFTQRRKDAYEALHPETRQGQAQAAGMNRSRGADVSANLAPTFTSDTAAKTGRSERDVQRDATRGGCIEPDILAQVKGTSLDKGTVLDDLARIPKADQAARVQELATEPSARKTQHSALPTVNSSVSLPVALAQRWYKANVEDDDSNEPLLPHEMEGQIAAEIERVLHAIYLRLNDPTNDAVIAILGGGRIHRCGYLLERGEKSLVPEARPQGRRTTSTRDSRLSGTSPIERFRYTPRACGRA